MADFFYGIASLGYLGFIFFTCILVVLELYLFFDGVAGRWVPDHWWEKLIPDQEVDRDLKITVEWLLRLGLYGCVVYGTIALGHHLFDYSSLLDPAEPDGPAYIR